MRRAGMALLVVCVLAVTGTQSVLAQSWKIAFNRSTDTGSQVFTINPDGTGLTQLTGGTGQGANWAPCWSPGGQYLCFSSTRTGQQVLFTLDRATGAQQQVTTGYKDESPHWSWAPSVNKVAFKRRLAYEGQTDHGLRVRDMTTGEDTLLVAGPAPGLPTFSPDGSLILYTYSDVALYVIPTAGGTPSLALDNGVDGAHIWHPAWSPVENEYGVGQVVGVNWVFGDYYLYVMPINNATGVIDWAGRRQLPGTFGGTYPTWSPDGEYIAYQTSYSIYDKRGRVIGTVYQLWTVKADGLEAPVYLTDGMYPEWSPVLPNRPPVAVAGGPYAERPGQPVLLDGSASYDPDGALLGYSWDFGDDLNSGWLDAPIVPVEHTYPGVGVYTALLMVFDPGGLSAGDVATVTIAEGSTEMHVSGIDMANGGSQGKKRSVTATVYVVDGFGDPVAGADVTGDWIWEGGSLAPKTLTTDAGGRIVDWTGYLSGISGKVLTYTVQSITKDGWTYDSAANVETSDTYLVP